jgi:tetratricopeptide (TPR) repeat protein
MAIDLCEEYKKAIPAELYAKAWQLTGIGYGMMAREVHQKEQRATLYEKAIQALNLAVSHHADNAEAYYHLALQHADGRNIGQAMVAIKQSLQLDPMRVRAWHLLVLLVSATKDLEGALRLCQVGLDASEWQVNPDGSGEQQGSASEGEDVLALMMTRVALEEALYGPLQALERLNALFVLYGRVFAGDGGGSAASEMNTTVRREAAAERPARSLGSSRRHAQQPSTGRSTRLDVPMSSYAGSVTGGQTGARSAPTVASSRSSYSLASRVTTRVRLRRQRALKALTELWLVSAASFQRMKRYDDARQAIEEAESADSESAAVSCQAGLLLLEQGKIEEALTAFSKAVFLEPHHVQGTVLLARANMLLGKCPLAEGLLRTTTRGRGWNHADAWYYLGNVYRQTERVDRAKECFWYALDLESTRPIRPFYTLLP